MKIGWRSSTPEEVTEIDAAGNPVPSSLTPAEDLALRTASLGLCEECGGPLTEIWSAGCSTVTVTYGSPDDRPADGGAGGSWPPPESWRFCSREHMDAFLTRRSSAEVSLAVSGHGVGQDERVRHWPSSGITMRA